MSQLSLGRFPWGITMKVAIKGALLLTAALLAAPLAHAQVAGESVTGFAGNINAIPDGVNAKAADKSATNAVTIVYDNTTSPVLFGLSSTDLTSTFGDELFLTSTGLLSSHKFGVFNGSPAANSLLTATFQIGFFDAITSASLGGYTVNVNFGAGLPGGSFSTITVSPLDPLLLLITSTDVIVTQKVIARTGTATRLGFVSRTPATVGSSPGFFFAQSATIGGGVAGFYNSASGAADLIHQVGLNPPPVGAKSTTWSRVKSLYR